MARKSRKHPNIDLICKPSRNTVGYIRLSVRDKDSSGSVENQKLISEEWGRQHQTLIMHYYIDNGFGGNRFERLTFQMMIQDIIANKIVCIVVKDLSRLCRDHIVVGYHVEVFFPRQHIRFMSVNDQFDIVDGVTNQDKEVPIQSKVRIPLF